MCEDITWEKNPQDVDEWFVRLWLLFRWLWLTCRQNSPKKNKGQKPRRLQPSPNWFHRLQELAPLHFFRGGSEFFFFYCFTVTVLLLSFILSLQGSVDEPVQWLSGQKYCSIYMSCVWYSALIGQTVVSVSCCVRGQRCSVCLLMTDAAVLQGTRVVTWPCLENRRHDWCDCLCVFKRKKKKRKRGSELRLYPSNNQQGAQQEVCRKCTCWKNNSIWTEFDN